MLPEEKFGCLEMPGEVNPAEEEDTSDAPTVVIPREHRKATNVEEEFFWLPF